MAKCEPSFLSPPYGCAVRTASAEDALGTVDESNLVVLLRRLGVVETVAVRASLRYGAPLDALVVLEEALVVDCAAFAVRDADVLDKVAPGVLDVAKVDRHVENVHRVAVRQQFSEVRFN